MSSGQGGRGFPWSLSRCTMLHR